MNFQHILQKSASPAVKFTALVLATTFISTTLMPVSDASARNKHHHRRHHSSAGDVVLGGIIGLTIGAIAEDVNRRRYDRVHRRAYEPYERPPFPVYDEYDPEYSDYDREPRRVRPYAKREPRPFRPYASREPAPLKRYKKQRRRTQHNNFSGSGSPKVITYSESASIEPWSDSWQDYCRTKYRSFNPKSGTFLGYDGDRHFCVAK